jgi:hypothetical protein
MSARELEAFREEGLSASRREEFRLSAQATSRWDRAHPADVAAVLDWIDALRAAFGDTPVDRTPWRGSDYRL